MRNRKCLRDFLLLDGEDQSPVLVAPSSRLGELKQLIYERHLALEVSVRPNTCLWLCELGCMAGGVSGGVEFADIPCKAKPVV